MTSNQASSASQPDSNKQTNQLTDQVMVVLCTCPERITAESLAKQLVEQGLAACVNLLNDMTSVYLWENETKIEPEVQLIIKTTQATFNELNTWLYDAHPYETPEIVALPVIAGNENYLQWVIEQTKK